MKLKWFRSGRARILLTLQLAVVLPAAALIFLNFRYVNSVQRDKLVEAAIQRDFQQVLAISEKKLDQRAQAMVAEIQAQFPGFGPNLPAELDGILERYPYVAHVFVCDHEKGVIARSQPGRLSDPWFQKESAHFITGMAKYMPVEMKDLLEKFFKADNKPMFFGEAVDREGDTRYLTTALFPVPRASKERTALAGVSLDADFLKERFFPGALNDLVSEYCSGNDKNRQMIMMVRMKGKKEPLAASAAWDGGVPEIERTMEGTFRGLTLAIKYRGTTLAAMGGHLVRTSFLILGVLSLMLAGGVLLTHRNVVREMELARLKSDFVSNVSHELRTPLSLIRLYAETLELGRLADPAKYQEYYRIIRKESERLTALINNILDFSRIEAGRKEYDLRETDLAELVRNTLDSYRYQIEQQGFVLEQSVAGDLPPLRVDREAIARSLLNLVNNALKYSPKDKFLGVNLYRENGAVRLEVIDHGIGIPRSEQEKIFHQFYRVGDPLVHNTKGTGLGLSLVRHIARAHGGEVRVESAPGKGSKFTILLPLKSDGAVAPEDSRHE